MDFSLDRRIEMLERTPLTLRALLDAWATHGVHHIRQACRALTDKFRDQVGPWREYLNTLPPRDT